MKKLARNMAHKAKNLTQRNAGKVATIATVAVSTMSASAAAPDATTLVATTNSAFELAGAAALVFVGFGLVLGIGKALLRKR